MSIQSLCPFVNYIYIQKYHKYKQEDIQLLRFNFAELNFTEKTEFNFTEFNFTEKTLQQYIYIYILLQSFLSSLSILNRCLIKHLIYDISSPSGSVIKSLPAMKEKERYGFSLWVRTIPWRRKWQRTPVIFPRKPQGQRSLEAYHLQGQVTVHRFAKELDMTKRLNKQQPLPFSRLPFYFVDEFPLPCQSFLV